MDSNEGSDKGNNEDIPSAEELEEMFGGIEVPNLRFADREAWLMAAVDSFRPMFEMMCRMGHGDALPRKVNVSVGFSIGSTQENKNILATTWARQVSTDKTNHVFVSPLLDDPMDVLAVLLHELIHVADDCQSAHRGYFATVAKLFGFGGRLTEIHPDEYLRGAIKAIAVELGEYPHARMDLSMVNERKLVPTGGPFVGDGPTRFRTGPREQTNRQLKVQCQTIGCRAAAHAYKARLSRSQIEAFGTPLCPVCHQPMTEC